MVAALHSFVGIAATIIGFSSFGKIFGFDIQNSSLKEDVANLVETYIGVFIGAITFTGSVVAWGKLNGNFKSEALIINLGGRFKSFRHWLNLAIILTSIALIFPFIIEKNIIYLSIMCLLALFLGWHLVIIFH